jgi:hypothetical protein
MPRKTLVATLRHVSPWRLILLTLVVYVTIRLAIPWLAGVGVPFWARAFFLAMGPAVGVLAGPWLFPRRH